MRFAKWRDLGRTIEGKSGWNSRPLIGGNRTYEWVEPEETADFDWPQIWAESEEARLVGDPDWSEIFWEEVAQISRRKGEREGERER